MAAALGQPRPDRHALLIAQNNLVVAKLDLPRQDDIFLVHPDLGPGDGQLVAFVECDLEFLEKAVRAKPDFEHSPPDFTIR